MSIIGEVVFNGLIVKIRFSFHKPEVSVKCLKIEPFINI